MRIINEKEFMKIKTFIIICIVINCSNSYTMLRYGAKKTKPLNRTRMMYTHASCFNRPLVSIIFETPSISFYRPIQALHVMQYRNEKTIAELQQWIDHHNKKQSCACQEQDLNQVQKDLTILKEQNHIIENFFVNKEELNAIRLWTIERELEKTYDQLYKKPVASE